MCAPSAPGRGLKLARRMIAVGTRLLTPLECQHPLHQPTQSVSSSLVRRSLRLRLQITSIAVSRNIRRREGGSIPNLIQENPADRAIGTSQPQPLIIRALVAIDGCLDLSRFFVQILIRDINRVIKLNQKSPLEAMATTPRRNPTPATLARSEAPNGGVLGGAEAAVLNVEEKLRGRGAISLWSCREADRQ